MNHIEFDEITTAQIDARLNYDILEHEKKIARFVILGYIILVFVFRGYLSYWLKFGMAFPEFTATKPISVQNDPIQENYTEEETKEKTFEYTSLLNKHKIKIMPMAHYNMSCTVVAYNHDFLFISDFFDSAALYDLGCAWGKLGDKNYYKNNFKSYSAKTELTGSRILWTEAKGPISEEDWNYAKNHWSHTHIVPANRNIMAAMLSIKVWDKVSLEGELVDMEYIDKRGRLNNYHTSMSRNDSGAGDRGNGSCETMYVTKIQIGDKLYK